MVREYRSSDLEAVVALFQRSVLEVASRDYSPAQLLLGRRRQPICALGPSVSPMEASSSARAMITSPASPELTPRVVSICFTFIPVASAKALPESSWNSSFLGPRVEGYGDCKRRSVLPRGHFSSAWGFALCGRK